VRALVTSTQRTLLVLAATATVAQAAPGAAESGSRLEQNILQRAGIDQEHLHRLVDGRPLAEADLPMILKLLYDFRRLDVAFTDRWSKDEVPWHDLLRDPGAYRGQMFNLTGRVAGISEARTPAEWIDQFELDRHYRCEMRLGDGPPTVMVLTPRIPRVWPVDRPLRERVGAAAMFVKLAGTDPGEPRPVFVARRLAWYPDRVAPRWGVNFGKTVLADLGMDIGLWDDVDNRKPLTARDREPFFQALWAVGQAGTRQLVRLARRDLAARAPQWQTSARQLVDRLAKLRRQQQHLPGGHEKQKQLGVQVELAVKNLAQVRRSLDRGRKGAHSVVPLFNEPDRQFGQLVVLEGTARRAVKIHVGSAQTRPGMHDVWQRFGFDHYYEIDLFTDDSQNNPIVFCVRHLPAGMPAGTNICEPVRIAGFYFKSWAYAAAPDPTSGGLAAAADQERWQLAPLLIGREPIWMRPVPAGNRSHAGLLAGGLFVVTLLGVWLGLWKYARGDRRFDQRARALRQTADAKVSLDELGRAALSEPDFGQLVGGDQGRGEA